MEYQDGKPCYSEGNGACLFVLGDQKESGFFMPTWPPKGPCLGDLWGLEGPQSRREVLLPHCSTWATYPSPENLGSPVGQAQPPLSVTGSVPLMRRGASRCIYRYRYRCSCKKLSGLRQSGGAKLHQGRSVMWAETRHYYRRWGSEGAEHVTSLALKGGWGSLGGGVWSPWI